MSMLFKVIKNKRIYIYKIIIIVIIRLIKGTGQGRHPARGVGSVTWAGSTRPGGPNPFGGEAATTLPSRGWHHLVRMPQCQGLVPRRARVLYRGKAGWLFAERPSHPVNGAGL